MGVCFIWCLPFALDMDLKKVTAKGIYVGGWWGVVGLCVTRPPWWRHQMETFSALLAICARSSPVTGEFPAQRPVTRSFGVFFDLRLNKRSSKQSWGWWFETPRRPLWRHCNARVKMVYRSTVFVSMVVSDPPCSGIYNESSIYLIYKIASIKRKLGCASPMLLLWRIASLNGVFLLWKLSKWQRKQMC